MSFKTKKYYFCVLFDLTTTIAILHRKLEKISIKIGHMCIIFQTYGRVNVTYRIETRDRVKKCNLFF